MRARFAYITSLGTTAILVAAALLMLGVVGAIVAFHGWPGGGNGQDVHALPLNSDGATKPVALVTRVKSARATAALTRTGATTRAVTARTSTAGLVKQGGDGSVVTGVVMVPNSTRQMHPTAPAPNQPTRVPVSYQPSREIPPPDPGGPGAIPYTGVPLPGLAEVPVPQDPGPALPDAGGTIEQLVPPLPPPPAVAVTLPGL